MTESGVQNVLFRYGNIYKFTTKRNTNIDTYMFIYYFNAIVFIVLYCRYKRRVLKNCRILSFYVIIEKKGGNVKMEEKEIIKGKPSNLKKIFIGISVLGLLLIVCEGIKGDEQNIPLEYVGLGLIIIGLFMIFYISSSKIIVTNKRIYGIGTFKRRVDLPLDTISAIGTSIFNGIDIGTSAGRIRFKGIENNSEIHTEISKLLNNRQVQEQIKNTDTTEELKKYKELLDSEVITQEEFEAKKKQLLEL